jgi:hypothetical protein
MDTPCTFDPEVGILHHCFDCSSAGGIGVQFQYIHAPTGTENRNSYHVTCLFVFQDLLHSTRIFDATIDINGCDIRR